MLKKRARLTSLEVRAILKDGRSVRSGTLSAKFRPGSPKKAAVVVKTAVAKGAVARNRLRRSAYAALRTALPEGVHAVIFLNKPAVTQAEINDLCSKLS